MPPLKKNKSISEKAGSAVYIRKISEKVNCKGKRTTGEIK